MSSVLELLRLLLSFVERFFLSREEAKKRKVYEELQAEADKSLKNPVDWFNNHFDRLHESENNTIRSIATNKTEHQDDPI